MNYFLVFGEFCWLVGPAVPEVSNWNSQFLISVPSLFVAVAWIYVLPKINVTLTVLSSTDWKGRPISMLNSPSF